MSDEQISKLIKEHLESEVWHSHILLYASVQNYYETGKVSGMLHDKILTIVNLAMEEALPDQIVPKSTPVLQRQLNRVFLASKVFNGTLFDAEEVIGKKLVDIYFLYEGTDEEEMILVFEDGKQIEIIRTEDNFIDVQTD